MAFIKLFFIGKITQYQLWISGLPLDVSVIVPGSIPSCNEVRFLFICFVCVDCFQEILKFSEILSPFPVARCSRRINLSVK